MSEKMTKEEVSAIEGFAQWITESIVDEAKSRGLMPGDACLAAAVGFGALVGSTIRLDKPEPGIETLIKQIRNSINENINARREKLQ